MRITIRGIVLCISFFLIATFSEAEIRPGVRLGAYFDADSAFIGGEVLGNITDSWYFNPNIEYVFVDNGDLITFNFDAHYDFATDRSWYFWLGGGLAIIYFNPDSQFRRSDTDLGVNIFMGIGFPIKNGRFVPYVQPKVILSDNSEFSLAFGFRF